jgi:outer membrane protein assembly factor BamB
MANRQPLLIVLLLACSSKPVAPPPSGLASPTFHGDRARLGWNDAETELTVAHVSKGLVRAWSSPKLDTIAINGTTFDPHLFATPVYADDVMIGGLRSSVVFAATTSGFVYAIAAFPIPRKDMDPILAGTILWRTSLGTPIVVPLLDGGIPLGVLGTPFLDLASKRIYVASIDQGTWKVFALDIGTGAIASGWPVVLDSTSVEAANKNAGMQRARFNDAVVVSQRSALNLSPDGATLYVSFGSYFDGGLGWMVAIDTGSPKIAATFSGSPQSQARCPDQCNLDQPSAGMWSAGGPSIDDDGRVFTTTGNSPIGQTDVPGVWGQSLLSFTPSLDLSGTYTPFDYCATDIADADISGSAPVLLPMLDGKRTTTFGSKQGVVYLVDRDALPGAKDKRPPCDPTALDRSLEKSLSQISVFGPFSEGKDDNNLDHAKMRSTPAFFRDGGQPILIASGTTKNAALDGNIAPSLARLRIDAGKLVIEKTSDDAAVFKNPGSPAISSHDGGLDAIAWVLDENAKRTDALIGPIVPHPILYAFDAKTLKLLWKASDLQIGGKYNHPVVAHGTVMVGTDRIEAFR